MKQFVLLLSAVAAIALASGCACCGGDKSANTAKPAQEDNARFVGLDPEVQRSVTCTQMQVGQTADGRMRVSANLRNRENRRLEVQANCVFKDIQGFAVDETPYRTVFLDENATETISFESFRKDVTNYTIRVRQAR